MFWHVSVCLSTGGGSVSQLSRGGGGQSSWGGSVQPGGSVQLGGSVQPGGGFSPARGEGQSAGGGGGVSQDRTTEWVLTTQRAVCLLCSRRRTFLYCYWFQYSLLLVFGQWLNIPLERIAYWPKCISGLLVKWNIQSSAKYPTINYIGIVSSNTAKCIITQKTYEWQTWEQGTRERKSEIFDNFHVK